MTWYQIEFICIVGINLLKSKITIEVESRDFFALEIKSTSGSKEIVEDWLINELSMRDPKPILRHVSMPEGIFGLESATARNEAKEVIPLLVSSARNASALITKNSSV